MGDGTGIEWATATWNPATGCDRVSPGCDNCYALGQAKRLKAMGQAKYQTDGNPRTSGPGFGVAVHQDALYQPLRWERPRRIFVNSMGDLFHEAVPDGFIAQVWNVMAQCPQHTFIILTKRHARMRAWVRRWADRTGDRQHDKPSGMPPMPRGPEAVRATYTSGRGQLFADMLDSMGEPPPGAAYPLYDWMEGQRFWPAELFNVWLGVSVEDQRWADIRIPALLETPAAVRFLSCEPLLGPAKLDPHWLTLPHDLDDQLPQPLRGQLAAERRADAHKMLAREGIHKGLVDWVIVGGESGPHARPMHPDWARQIRDDCQAAGVPYFHKQNGEWAPRPAISAPNPDTTASVLLGPDSNGAHVAHERQPGHEWLWRVGKHKAGRELDGREWSEFPHPFGAVA